jgi:NDP-sugar pyrophosphorylase family protein
LKDLISYHQEHGACATIAMHQREVKIDLGVINLNGDNTIEGYVEKPTMEYCVSMGIYVFEPKILAYIPKAEYLDFPDLVLRLLESGERVMGYPFDGYWQDLGRPDDYQRAWEDFESLRPSILEGAA